MHTLNLHRRILAWAVLALLPCLAVAPAQAQQPKELIGFMQLSGAKHIDKRVFPGVHPYSLNFVFTYLEFDVERVPAGGVAVFGAFDSGEVKLLAHVGYAPNIAEAMYDRELFPPGEWLEPSDTPRFVMVCGWPQEDGAPPTEVFHTYAERDDGRTMITDESPSYVRLWMTWRSVSSKQARAKFKDQDYCHEIATTSSSSAALWLPYIAY